MPFVIKKPANHKIRNMIHIFEPKNHQIQDRVYLKLECYIIEFLKSRIDEKTCFVS